MDSWWDAGWDADAATDAACTESVEANVYFKGAGGASRWSEATSASGIALDEGGAGGVSRRSEVTSASGIALDEGAPVVIGLEL